MTNALVAPAVRFQHSHPGSAGSDANVGIKGPLATISASGALDLTFAIQFAAGSVANVKSAPLAPIDAPRPDAQVASRPNADFIAHLIATKAQAPQTRVRRRAEPEEAVAAYGSVGHWPTPLGRALSRSL